MFSQRTNESFLEFRLKLYLSGPKLSVPGFAVSSCSQVGHRNLKCFSGTSFLWNIFTPLLFHPLCLYAREKKKCCLFFFKPLFQNLTVCECTCVSLTSTDQVKKHTVFRGQLCSAGCLNAKCNSRLQNLELRIVQRSRIQTRSAVLGHFSQESQAETPLPVLPRCCCLIHHIHPSTYVLYPPDLWGYRSL